MVRIRNLLFFLTLLCCQYDLLAQLIRKDHREMTPSEKRVYRDAIIARKDFMLAQAEHHGGHFNTEIHTRASPINGTQFLSWHRLFLLEVEDQLRTSGIANADKITIPYWNWIANNGSAVDLSWNNTGFLDLAPFQAAGFVADNDIDPSTPRTQITRQIGSFNIATNTEIAGMNNNTDFITSNWSSVNNSTTFFSKSLELFHNIAHSFVGGNTGTMNAFESPADPVFYLHHNFIDKLWQDWEDKENTIKSSFPTPISPINDWSDTHPNTITDARHMVVNLFSDNSNITRGFEVWFASNKKLLLDGLNGAFTTNTSSNAKKTYCYIAWNGSAVEGTIYAGDVQRDASDNVIADTKGGFIVDGAGADFYAGSSIELRPGFSTVLGSPFSAQIVDKPCGYTTNNLMAEPDNDPVLYLQSKTDKKLKAGEGKAYPNPFTSELSIEYNVETDTPLSIELVNALGQSVWQQKYGIQAQGLFNATIPTQDLPKGLYHVLIRNVKNQVTLKVVR